MERSARTRRDAGFSLIEVMIAILVLAIVAGGIVQSFVASGAEVARSRVDAATSAVAGTYIEQIRRMDYSDIGIGATGNPSGTLLATRTVTRNGISYRVDTDVRYVDDPAIGQPRNCADYKRTTITVTPLNAKGKAVTLQEETAPPSAGFVKGKAAIIATVLDGVLPSSPVPAMPNVPATLTGTSPTRTSQTDDNGKVAFCGLDPSNTITTASDYTYKVALNQPGYVMEPLGTPPNNEQHLVAGQLWQPIFNIFKPSTVRVSLLDRGQPIQEQATVLLTSPRSKQVLSAGPPTSAPAFPHQDEKTSSTGLFTFTTLKEGGFGHLDGSGGSVAAGADIPIEAHSSNKFTVDVETPTTNLVPPPPSRTTYSDPAFLPKWSDGSVYQAPDIACYTSLTAAQAEQQALVPNAGTYPTQTDQSFAFTLTPKWNFPLPGSYGRIDFTVRDSSTGNPVPGANVEVWGGPASIPSAPAAAHWTATADSAGKVRLCVDPNSSPSDSRVFTFKVSDSAHLDGQATQVVQLGAPVPQTVKLAPTSSPRCTLTVITTGSASFFEVFPGPANPSPQDHWWTYDQTFLTSGPPIVGPFTYVVPNLPQGVYVVRRWNGSIYQPNPPSENVTCNLPAVTKTI